MEQLKELGYKRSSRSFDVRDILNRQYGFYGGHRKGFSPMSVSFIDGVWHVGRNDGDHVSIPDTLQLVPSHIAKLINHNYDLLNTKHTTLEAGEQQ